MGGNSKILVSSEKKELLYLALELKTLTRKAKFLRKAEKGTQFREQSQGMKLEIQIQLPGNDIQRENRCYPVPSAHPEHHLLTNEHSVQT
jgi:hypothetical protein